jgi:hypothetical protein
MLQTCGSLAPASFGLTAVPGAEKRFPPPIALELQSIPTALKAPPTRYAGAIRRRRNTPILQYSNTPPARNRGQPVRRSFRFMLNVGLASEARSTTRAFSEGGRTTTRTGTKRLMSNLGLNPATDTGYHSKVQ